MGKGKKVDMDDLTFRASTENVMEFEAFTGAEVLASMMDMGVSGDELVFRKELYGTTHKAYALVYYLGLSPKLREKISYGDFIKQLPLEKLRGKLDGAYRSILKAFMPEGLFEEGDEDDNEDGDDEAGQDEGNAESPGGGQTSGG